MDEKNYFYWKIKVKVYIKAIDEKAWRAILTGWTLPLTTTNGVSTSKFEDTWSKDEDVLATTNFKALNAIFFSIDDNQFKLIFICEFVKDA